MQPPSKTKYETFPSPQKVSLCPSPSTPCFLPQPLSGVNHHRLALPAVDFRINRSVPRVRLCAQLCLSACCVCHLSMLARAPVVRSVSRPGSPWHILLWMDTGRCCVWRQPAAREDVSRPTGNVLAGWAGHASSPCWGVSSFTGSTPRVEKCPGNGVLVICSRPERALPLNRFLPCRHVTWKAKSLSGGCLGTLH